MSKTKKKLNTSKKRNNDRYEDIKSEYQYISEELKKCADKHKCKPISINEHLKVFKKCKTKKKDIFKCKDSIDINKKDQKYHKCIESNCNKQNITVNEFKYTIKLLMKECKYHVKKYNKKCSKFDEKLNGLEKEQKKLDKTFKMYIKLRKDIIELKSQLMKLKPKSEEYKQKNDEINKIQNSKIFKEHMDWDDKYFKLLVKANKCYSTICKFSPKTEAITKKYKKYIAYY